MNVEEFKKIIKTKINEDIELKDNNENARYIKRIDNIKDTERVEILNKIKKILAKKDFDDKKYIKNHVLIWHWPLWNLKNAYCIIVWTFPWENTLKYSNKKNLLYYCDTWNQIRNILENIFNSSTDNIKMIISELSCLESIKATIEEYYLFLTEKIDSDDLNIFNKKYSNIRQKLNKQIKELKENLHSEEVKFCEQNHICLWDRVEICFCKEWSSDTSRVPILYTDFSKQKKIIITNGDIGYLDSFDIKALYLWEKNKDFYEKYKEYENINIDNYKWKHKIYRRRNGKIKLEPFSYITDTLKVYVCSSSSWWNNWECDIRIEIRKRAFTKSTLNKNSKK